MHISVEVYIQRKFYGKYGFPDYFKLNRLLSELPLDKESVYETILVSRDYYKTLRNKPDYSKTTLAFSDSGKLKALMKKSEKYSWRGGYILYMRKLNIGNRIYLKLSCCSDQYVKHLFLSKNKIVSREIDQKYLIDKIVDSNDNKIDYHEDLTTLNGRNFTIPNPVDNFYTVYLKINPDNVKANNIAPTTQPSLLPLHKIEESSSNRSYDVGENSPLLYKTNPDTKKSGSISEDNIKESSSYSINDAEKNSSVLSKTRGVFSRLFNFSSKNQKSDIN